MSGVRVGPVTIWQLTKFGPWKRVDSTPHPLVSYLVTIPTPLWDPLETDGRDYEHVLSYPRRLWEYASVWILVSIRSITSNLPCSTACMACANPKPLPPRMFSVSISNPGGRGGRRRGGGGAVFRQLAPWRISQEKVSGILVSPGNKGRKSKENPRIGYCRIYDCYFFRSPLSEHWETPILRGCLFWHYRTFGVGEAPPGLSLAAVSPVE